MNRTKAMGEILKGKKLTHHTFTPDEWVTGDRYGYIVDEVGNRCDFVDFWRNRTGSDFASGWEYVKEGIKQRFFAKMDSDEVYFPQTEQEIQWFEEWLELHPELTAEAEAACQRINEQQAAEYMVTKILARSFIEKQGEGVVTAKLEPRKITLYGTSGNDTFEINL